MARRKAVYPLERWTAEVREHLPHLSAPQAAALGAWSFGMVLARSCGLTAVAGVLAATLGTKVGTERQRLREFCYPAERKRGRRRRAVAVEPCFAPLLGWVLARWPGDHVLLGLDASTLGERFVVLAISVLYRGCAIPVAWAIVPAGEKGAWRPVWERLLLTLRAGVPRRGLAVLVLADRGLYARWLFRAITAQGWHPFLRVNTGGLFRPATWRAFHPLRRFAPAPGQQWQGTGVAFRSAHLPCTLLARWEAGHRDPWLLLTDLPPEASEAGWYGLRQWIEHGFRVSKRGGWQWQQTKMTKPDRAERLWLAIAVATLWLLAIGGEAEADEASAAAETALAEAATKARQHRHQRPRLVGVFRRGWQRLLAALLTAAPLPLGAFLPEPLPHRAPLPLTELHDDPEEAAA
jgi:hypothetical protein